MQGVAHSIQSLPLPAMFLVSLAVTSLAALLIIGTTRMSLRHLGYGPGTPFPLRDVVVTVTSAMFALMVAFSAAGIWTESNQARTAVQREANALENMRSMAESFPPALRERVLADVKAYAKQVLDGDWPAMTQKVHFTDQAYDEAERILIDLIESVSREAAALPSLAGAAIGQLVEARSARLQRITLATQGATSAQWMAMILIAVAAMTGLAVLHNHDRAAQLFAMAIYTGGTSAALFVILAHDRPFVGRLSVGAEPIMHLLKH